MAARDPGHQARSDQTEAGVAQDCGKDSYLQSLLLPASAVLELHLKSKDRTRTGNTRSPLDLTSFADILEKRIRIILIELVLICFVYPW